MNVINSTRSTFISHNDLFVLLVNSHEHVLVGIDNLILLNLIPKLGIPFGSLIQLVLDPVLGVIFLTCTLFRCVSCVRHHCSHTSLHGHFWVRHLFL
jgi:hypothetical protein